MLAVVKSFIIMTIAQALRKCSCFSLDNQCSVIHDYYLTETTCNPPTFLLNQTCVQNCPPFHTADSSSRTCDECKLFF